MIDPTEILDTVRVVVEPIYVADSHRFRDLREVQMTGSLNEARLRSSLQRYAEEQGDTLGEVEVEWVVRVRANAWPMPEGLLPTPSEMQWRGLDPLEEMERARTMWRNTVEKVEAKGLSSVVLDVRRPSITFTGKNAAEVREWVNSDAGVDAERETWFFTKSQATATEMQAWRFAKADGGFTSEAKAAVYDPRTGRWLPVSPGDRIERQGSGYGVVTAGGERP